MTSLVWGLLQLNPIVHINVERTFPTVLYTKKDIASHHLLALLCVLHRYPFHIIRHLLVSQPNLSSPVIA